MTLDRLVLIQRIRFSFEVRGRKDFSGSSLLRWPIRKGDFKARWKFYQEACGADTYDCFYTKETRSFTRRARFIFPSRKIETVRAPMAASFLDLESAHGRRWTPNGSADDANSQNSRKLPTTLSIHLTRWLKPRGRFYDETKRRVSLETWLI